ncbi:MAG: tRNA pseudouridine(55) synthase TruB [Bacteroidetes bacterium HGW-Bacteroidetes-16]|jgi:tRNA pseudouridine55 synthase|nr:MAG: tRNA pseudouridine(55) synthase TruB [Bacteroidetes bacterium HGW-Bacteroidetes-16]
MTFNFEEGEVLLIDKPLKWTSFDVVNHLRSFIKRAYNIKNIKVGHAGTLDPLASGLLIVCTGKLTKHIDTYQGLDKVYEGSMRLGATTPTYDLETEIDQTFDISGLTPEQLIQATSSFIGDIQQIPPIYSALKIDGKRAFLYARNHEEVIMKSRQVTIRQFTVLNINLPDADFVVHCSKGTYIRSLVYDFGKALNNGACLTALRRTLIGDFSVDNAWTLEKIKQEIASQSPFPDRLINPSIETS